MLQAKTRDTSTRQPGKLPERNNDDVSGYFCGIRQEFSFLSQVHIAGVTFENRICASDASLVENADKPVQYGYPLIAMTEKQVKYLLDRAKGIIKRIPARYDWDKKEKQPAFEITLDKLIFIEPQETFNPVSFFSRDADEISGDIAGDVASAIRSSGKKKK